MKLWNCKPSVRGRASDTSVLLRSHGAPSHTAGRGPPFDLLRERGREHVEVHAGPLRESDPEHCGGGRTHRRQPVHDQGCKCRARVSARFPRSIRSMRWRCGTTTLSSVRVAGRQSARGEQLVGPPKTDAGRRTLSLPANVIPALEEHLQAWAAPSSDGLVFVGEKGAPLRPHVWQSEWNRARRSVGLERIHLHDLRHVAGTLAAATGAGTKELMHLLGHVSPQAALRYQHATRERDTFIAEAMERLIEAARTDPKASVRTLARRHGALMTVVVRCARSRLDHGGGFPHDRRRRHSVDLRKRCRAGDENRTRVLSLGS